MSSDTEPAGPPTDRTAWLASTVATVATAGITFGAWAAATRSADREFPDSRLLLAVALLVYLPLLFIAVRGRFTMWIAVPYGIAFGLLCVVAVPAVSSMIGWQ